MVSMGVSALKRLEEGAVARRLEVAEAPLQPVEVAELQVQRLSTQQSER
jgi:hypothetical protein